MLFKLDLEKFIYKVYCLHMRHVFFKNYIYALLCLQCKGLKTFESFVVFREKKSDEY